MDRDDRRWQESKKREARLTEFPEEIQYYDGIPINNYVVHCERIKQLCHTPGSHFLHIYYDCEEKAIWILKDQYRKEEARKLAQKQKEEAEDREFESLPKPENYSGMTDNQKRNFRLEWRLNRKTT